MKLHFPSGKELRDPYAGVAWGRELKDDDDSGVIARVDDGNTATESRIQQARRQWPEASATDFEATGPRSYIDRASGVEYRRSHGAPLLSVGTDANRGITCFFVANEELVFLQRADYVAELTVRHGEVVGAKIADTDVTRGGRIA